MVKERDYTHRYIRAIRLIKDNIQEYKSLKVLEVGVGKNTILFKDLFKTLKVLDTDKIKLSLNCKNEIPYVVASGNNIPFSDNSFDLITCISTLDHIPNPLMAFKEMCRVSKKYVLIGQDNNILSVHPKKYFSPLTTQKPQDHLGHMCWIPFFKIKRLAEQNNLELVNALYWGMPFSHIGSKMPCININFSKFYLALYKKKRGK